MKKMIVLLGSMLAFQANAERLQTSIHSIVQGDSKNPSFIKLGNGRVAFLKQSEKFDFDSLEGKKVEIELDDESNLVSIQSLGNIEKLKMSELKLFNTAQAFEPTVLSSLDEAEAIFNRLNPNYKVLSECFNRAHVWSYEEFTKNQVKTMKTWVFFTRSYINKHRFKWWFHVAPSVMVNNEPRVMDFRYSHGTQTVKEWTDLFVFTKRGCKENWSYIEYDAGADQTQDCFIRTTNMYYWVPEDFKVEETTGYVKSEFNMYNVRAAYGQAF